MSGNIVVTPQFQVFTPLERITIFTPLGIRFWDAALDRPVRDGLSVSARRAGTERPVVRAFRTSSGVYAFRGLPGMHAIEYPSESDDPISEGSPPALTRFVVEVVDELRRFLPAVFEVDVPFFGVFPTGQGAVSAPPGFYLFSAPTRSTVSSLAVVRAQLVERAADGSEQPASYALLEVEVAGQPAQFGIADERGSVAVQLPYPRFAATLGPGSPLSDPEESQRQGWDARVRVRYDPGALETPLGSTIPNLRTIFSQRPGTIWAGLGAPPGQTVTDFSTELLFGRDLVLRHAPDATFVINRAV